jgi:hypothetical protein
VAEDAAQLGNPEVQPARSVAMILSWREHTTHLHFTHPSISFIPRELQGSADINVAGAQSESFNETHEMRCPRRHYNTEDA